MNTKEYVDELKQLLNRYPIDSIQHVVDTIRNTNGTIYTCGNGGSGSLAEHLAQDMYKMCGRKTVSLVSNMSTLTMIGNDYGWNEAFAYQLRDATADDVLIVISGSGNSINIMRALESFPGIKIGLFGYQGTGTAVPLCNLTVVADSMCMQCCEDMFSIYIHNIFHELM